MHGHKGKVLFLVIDAQALFCAPPSAEDIELLKKHGAVVPTQAEIDHIAAILSGINDTVDMLRANPDVIIGWAAMAPKKDFTVTHDKAVFDAVLDKAEGNLYQFYGVHPRNGDLFVAKNEASVFSNPHFVEYCAANDITPVYLCAFQGKWCVLSSAIKQNVWEHVEDLAAPIKTAVVHDLTADTYVDKGGTMYRHVPPKSEMMRRFEQHDIPTVLSSDIVAALARPAHLRNVALPGFEAKL